MRGARSAPPAALLVGGASAGLGVLAILVSILLATVMPAFSFPKPPGPYAVGTTTFNWVDARRQEMTGGD